jgi:excisionase family DNA binding protein
MHDHPSEPGVPPAPEPSIFLTPQELCLRWKVSIMFLWRMRQNGTLRAHKIGGGRRVRYSLADIERIESESRA